MHTSTYANFKKILHIRGTPAGVQIYPLHHLCMLPCVQSLVVSVGGDHISSPAPHQHNHSTSILPSADNSHPFPSKIENCTRIVSTVVHTVPKKYDALYGYTDDARNDSAPQKLQHKSHTKGIVCTMLNTHIIRFFPALITYI